MAYTSSKRPVEAATGLSFLALLPGIRLDLTNDEAGALLGLIRRATEDDRYPLSP
ncbi:MAG: hypothetical protein JO282_07025 [Alphaproteobacteria bacterium]|nr:hypothetical protein [Alphaproteobacteria bacterium]